MNKERIEKLITVLQEEPSVRRGAKRGFNMRRVFHDCGTPSCIAGYAITLFGEPLESKGETSCGQILALGAYARELLELPENIAEELFFPDSVYNNFPMERIKTEDAVKALKHVIAGNTKNLWDENVFNPAEED